MKISIREYIEKRNKLILDMDVEGLKELCKQVEIPLPVGNKAIIAGMNKVVVQSLSFPESRKIDSRKWLKDNGYTTSSPEFKEL